MHRTTSRLRGAALLLTGVIALTACGSGSSERSANDSSAPSSASSAPSSEPAPAEPAVAPAVVEAATFTGAVVDEFGAEQLQAAYAMAAEFLGETTFNEDLLRTNPARSADEFEFATAYMTGTMAADVRSLVAGALAEDEYGEMSQDLAAIFLWGLDGEEGLAFRETGPMVVDHTIGQAQAASLGDGRLQLKMRQTAKARHVAEGNPVLLPFEKNVTVALIPGPAFPYGWAIDGHEGSWSTGSLIPDPSS